MYDFAMIGDNVYIGGLQGEEFKLINNRFGVLKKIYSITSKTVLKYLADIQMNMYKFPINLNYVYKLQNVITDPIFLDGNVYDELCQLHDIKSAIIGIDDRTEHRLALCKTSIGLDVMLTISTLN